MSSLGIVSSVHSSVSQGEQPQKTAWQRLEEKSENRKIDYLEPKNVHSPFPDVRCASKTAVFVNVWNGYAFEKCYLHANKMGQDVAKRRFIAAQYPVPRDFVIRGDWAEYIKFWNAILQTKATIVDLTTANDRVTPYYPKEQQTIWDGYRMVLVAHQSEKEGVCQYQIQLTNPDSPSVKIQRYHFPKWPDHGVISVQELHTLVDRVEDLHTDPDTPLLVHCRGGVGRTGVLISAMIIKEHYKSGLLNKENLEDQVIDIVAGLRAERNEMMVTYENQFNLLIEYARSLVQ